MTMIRSRWIATALGSYIALHVIASSSVAQISLKAHAVTTANNNRACLVSLSNDSERDGLRAIKVRLFSEDSFVAEFGPLDLAPRQTSVVEQLVRLGTQCTGSDVFYRITYLREGTLNDLIVTAPRPTNLNSTIPALANQIVVALLALISAAVGAWMTHRFSFVREREKDRLAWRTKTHESLQPAVLNFLDTWGANPVPSMLSTHFAELKKKVDLGADLVSKYEATYKLLSDPKIDADEKRAAAKALDQSVRSFLKESAPFTPS